MMILNEVTIRKIERIKKYNTIAGMFNCFFYWAITTIVWLAVYFETYELYSFFIMSLVLAKGLISCASFVFNDSVQEILETTQYDRAKFKYENITI